MQRSQATSTRAILAFLSICLSPALTYGAQTADVPSKPNIIVVFTDDQGWADLSCQAAVADVNTPHIDRLAREGVRMDAGYVTAPQCVPSRAGLLAGRYQQRFGVDHNGQGPLPLEVETLPARLQKAGYVTGMVGKWHLEPNPSCSEWVAKNLPRAKPGGRRNLPIPAHKRAPYLPGPRGFSEFFFGNSSDYLANFNLEGMSLAPEGKQVRTGMYRLDAQSKAAVSFIRRNRDRPFFLYLAYFAPHVPLEATAKYLDRFPGPMPERRRYALAMISAMDDGVGGILQELQTHAIDETTLLFFISDNGAPLKIHKADLPISMRGGAWDGSLNDPWVGEKGMITEGGVRVPFVMRWKGVLPEGMVYQQPVISLDVAATAVALAGLPPAPDLDGVDLIPYLTGVEKCAPHEALYWRFWGQAAVRSGRWKYLRLADGTQYLFDLASPEHERKNLFIQRPAVAKELAEKLSAWTDGLHRPGLPDEGLNGQEAGWYEHYLGHKPK